MQSGNLFDFGKGGGGLYGDGRDATLDNWRIVEHGFAKLGPDRKTVSEEYVPSCMLAVDVIADRTEDDDSDYPESATQFYPIGALPLRRIIEIGWLDRLTAAEQQARRKDPGGYQPSTDNENASEEGSFVVFENKQNIWDGSAFAQFMDEVKVLLENTPGGDGYRDRGMAQGMAAFNGMRVHLGLKALPKGKRTLDEERITGQEKKARTILVPVSILSLPWTVAAAQPAVSKPAAGKGAAKAAVPKLTSAGQGTAAAAAATSTNAAGNATSNAGDDDERLAGYVKAALAGVGGVMQKQLLPSKLIAALAKEGQRRTPMMQRANSDEYLLSRSGNDWVYDPDNSTITAL